MNSGQKLIAVLLTVIAVLLGLNLVVTGSPRAVAEEVERGPVVPAVTATGLGYGTGVLFRLWSDGSVDRADFGSGCGPVTNSCQLIPPAQSTLDLTHDGFVGTEDLNLLLNGWGTVE